MRLLPVTGRTAVSPQLSGNAPRGSGIWLAEKELVFCPLERAKVPFREEDGPGARIPKPTCWRCFVIEFHKKIKSITESNKALKVFN